METKVCKKCGIEKEPGEFYKQSHRDGQYFSKCRSCVQQDQKEKRKTNYELIRSYEKKSSSRAGVAEAKKEYRKSERGKDSRAKGVKKWRARNPLKAEAHWKLNEAIRWGRILKQPCIICGNEKSQAHHEDYSLPLDVVWYCHTHHVARHKELREMRCVWDVTGKPIFPSEYRPDADEGLLLDGHI